MAKKIKPICGNCRLFDEGLGICRVVILHEGEKLNLPVEAKDPCFFEQEYFDPITGRTETFNEVKEIRVWVEDKDGKKTDGNGTVKIQFPKDLEMVKK